MPTVTADSPQTSQTGPAPPEPVPAFEKLVELYQGRITRLVQRLLGWSADVDDLVQEVFVAAWRGLPKFRGQSTIETWLMRIAINQCRRHRRRTLLRHAFHRRLKSERPSIPDSIDPLRADERSRGVRQAVHALPPRYREVIVLRYLEGLEVDQLMRVLRLSRTAADVRLHRARELLRGSLKELSLDE
jgi:RNA polymerase sigma-70 factor (ECF subfamily)